MSNSINVIKKIMVASYIVMLFSAFIPFISAFSWFFYLCLALTAVVHTLEYLVFRKRLLALNSGENHYLQTLLYGLLHWKPALDSPAQ